MTEYNVKKIWRRRPVSKLRSHCYFFQFMDDLEQSGSRIPDAWSINLTFAFITTFYLTKAETRTKISLTQLSYYCEWRYIFLKKCWPFAKNADISYIKGSWHYEVYSLKLCVCLPTKCQVSSIILTRFRQEGTFTPKDKTNP